MIHSSPQKYWIGVRFGFRRMLEYQELLPLIFYQFCSAPLAAADHFKEVGSGKDLAFQVEGYSITAGTTVIFCTVDPDSAQAIQIDDAFGLCG